MAGVHGGGRHKTTCHASGRMERPWRTGNETKKMAAWKEHGTQTSMQTRTMKAQPTKKRKRKARLSYETTLCSKVLRMLARFQSNGVSPCLNGFGPFGAPKAQENDRAKLGLSTSLNATATKAFDFSSLLGHACTLSSLKMQGSVFTLSNGHKNLPNQCEMVAK